jgi:PAS domain S-box-containing protein
MDLSNKRLIDSVFAGGGETGARMRALDWSTTTMGPLEQWPQSLRACVRIVLGSGHPMLISWGPDYTMLYNDAYGVVVGKKHPAALGCSCREVLAEAWDFIGPLFDKVYTEGSYTSTLTSQLFTFNRNNYLEECYFAFSYSPIPDDDGHVGGVLTACLDMTERVIEDRRRQVLRDLASRTAEARHEEEVWRVSAEILGQNRSSVPFAFLYEYRPVEYKACLASVSVETDGALHPAVIDCKNGESIWRFHTALAEDCLVVELGQRASALSIPGWPLPPQKATVLPIRLREHSEAAGFLVLGIHPGRAFDDTYRYFVRRIAEQIAIGLASARAYEQERQRAEALAEIDRAKTAFFSNVSHEFRTPLALMLGPLEEVLPEARDRLSPERHEQLVTVRRNAVRLLKLVNTLLDFSRIQAGRVQAVYEPTDLAGVTSEIASVFRSAMEKAGLRFSVECQPIAEPVYVDRDMWEKVVSNLLSNAFKFTFEGAVTVTLKPVDGAAELQVRDTGVGIPEDQRQRVFERFHRIEGTHARTYEGTGIGLALVQELVELHGGSVRVESALGKGSTFTVTIPRGTTHLPAERIQAARSVASTAVGAEAYAEEAQRWLPDEWGSAVHTAMLPKLTSLATSPRAEPAAKRELIVVADDNADMRQYLRHLLDDRYEVQSVADGRQALEVTRLLRPALVLADVMMPRLDGFGLLRAMRDDSALASTPVILVSARAGEESRVEGLQAGADDYLVKPFTARELLARVETHLKLANLRRETAEREARLRSEAELEHQKLRASEERLAETSRLYRELQNREAKIRRLVDANIVGVLVWDLEGRILDANDAFLRMVGYEREDLLSGRLRWKDLTPPEWLERDERLWARQLQMTGSVAPFEKEYFRRDGSRVPVLIGLATFEEGGYQGVAFVLDLTERKRAADALRGVQMELAHANRLATMGQLAASIAHEVNQPIGAARNNAHAALRFLAADPPDLAEVREALECVVNETYRAGDIIGRIRDQVKKVPPRKEDVDLNDAIGEVIALVRGELSKNRVSVQTQLAEGLSPVYGDRVQLQQVMLNLILNAIEAMISVDDEVRELMIRTESSPAVGLLVAVGDSGPGVAPEDRERIFESFYTTKAGGVGIGLSICRSIIDAHGGRLWADAHQRRGAVFRFTLPAHN